MNPFHFLFWVIICLIEFYPINTYAVQPLIQDKVPILKVEAENISPQKIGLEIGRQSKLFFPNIEYRYDQHLYKILNQTQFERLLKYKLPLLLKQINTNYRKEMEGVIASWSIIQENKLGDGFLSVDEYLILNLFANLGLAPNGTGFSAFGKVAQDQHNIVGRNMDWKTTPELRSLQTITVYSYKNKSIVNIGFSGIISILTGFNDQGLFLSYFNAEPNSPYIKYYDEDNTVRKNESTIFSLRKTLEKTKNTDQASNYLAKKVFSSANNILVADKRKVQVLEYIPHQKAKIRRWYSKIHYDKSWNAKNQIAVIDCNVLAILPNNCKDSKNNIHWNRLTKLAKFTPKNTAKKSDLSNILFDIKNRGNEIFNALTLNSVIFIPKTKELYFYTAPINIPENFIKDYKPIHQAYLNLLPSLTINDDSSNNIALFQIIMLIIIILIGVVIWIYKIPENILKRIKLLQHKR